MKKLIVAFIGAFVLSVTLASVDSSLTDFQLIKAGKGLYGTKTTGVPLQVIGVSVGNKVSVDSGGSGVVFGGTIAIPTANQLVIPTSAATVTTGSMNIIVRIGGVTYYLKGNVLP